MTERDYLSIAEVMEVLKKSRRTVYGYIHDGKLKAFKTKGGALMVKPDELKAFIENDVSSQEEQAQKTA